ncbi:hypothetical protein [Streptomyces luteireticuli]|uniref:Uncharacterized protein n=1 Tax=Streptomyces luteireticuli TaxID=173858 RepID=A0ABP3IC75_9ACTN
MSVLSVLHVPRTPYPTATGLRTALRTALRRVADGAVDSPVLHATGSPARPRPRAH